MPYVAFCALLSLLESTLLVRPLEESSVRSAPRRLAPWTRDELDLVRALLDHGISRQQIASLILRTTMAIDFQEQEGRIPAQLSGYPMTARQLTDQDIKLLRGWQEKAQPDPLHWAYGRLSAPQWLAPDAALTFRVIEVSPDPLTQGWLPQKTDPGFWNIYRQETEMAVQAVWADLAAQVACSGRGVVIIPPPDPHHAKRDALRELVRRMAGQPAPRGSIQNLEQFCKRKADAKMPDLVLLYRPELWTPDMISRLQTRTLIAVIPRLYVAEVAQKFNFFRLLAATQHHEQTGPSILPHVLRALPTSHDDDRPPYIWVKTAKYDAAWQQRWIEITTWPAGHRGGQRRKLERIQHTGLLNTTGKSARLEWKALSQLPEYGCVIAGRHDLYVRALVWYVITTGRWPLSPVLQHQKRPPWLSAPSPPHRQIMVRILRDLPDDAGTNQRPSQLRFVIGEVEGTTYIGH